MEFWQRGLKSVCMTRDALVDQTRLSFFLLPRVEFHILFSVEQMVDLSISSVSGRFDSN